MERPTASWVLRKNGKSCFETFSPHNADLIRRYIARYEGVNHYELVPIYDHLASLSVSPSSAS